MDFLISLQNVFLGLVGSASPEPERPGSGLGAVAGPGAGAAQHSGEETDEDVDGIPLDGAALLKGGRPVDSPLAVMGQRRASEDSLDGAPIEVAPVRRQDKEKAGGKPVGGFVSSKWETVDPEEVKAQAVTTRFVTRISYLSCDFLFTASYFLISQQVGD